MGRNNAELVKPTAKASPGPRASAPGYVIRNDGKGVGRASLWFLPQSADVIIGTGIRRKNERTVVPEVRKEVCLWIRIQDLQENPTVLVVFRQGLEDAPEVLRE